MNAYVPGLGYCLRASDDLYLQVAEQSTDEDVDIAGDLSLEDSASENLSTHEDDRPINPNAGYLITNSTPSGPVGSHKRGRQWAGPEGGGGKRQESSRASSSSAPSTPSATTRPPSTEGTPSGRPGTPSVPSPSTTHNSSPRLACFTPTRRDSGSAGQWPAPHAVAVAEAAEAGDYGIWMRSDADTPSLAYARASASSASPMHGTPRNAQAPSSASSSTSASQLFHGAAAAHVVAAGSGGGTGLLAGFSAPAGGGSSGAPGPGGSAQHTQARRVSSGPTTVSAQSSPRTHSSSSGGNGVGGGTTGSSRHGSGTPTPHARPPSPQRPTAVAPGAATAPYPGTPMLPARPPSRSTPPPPELHQLPPSSVSSATVIQGGTPAAPVVLQLLHPTPGPQAPPLPAVVGGDSGDGGGAAAAPPAGSLPLGSAEHFAATMMHATTLMLRASGSPQGQQQQAAARGAGSGGLQGSSEIHGGLAGHPSPPPGVSPSAAPAPRAPGVHPLDPAHHVCFAQAILTSYSNIQQQQQVGGGGGPHPAHPAPLPSAAAAVAAARAASSAVRSSSPGVAAALSFGGGGGLGAGGTLGGPSGSPPPPSAPSPSAGALALAAVQQRQHLLHLSQSSTASAPGVHSPLGSPARGPALPQQQLQRTPPSAGRHTTAAAVAAVGEPLLLLPGAPASAAAAAAGWAGPTDVSTRLPTSAADRALSSSFSPLSTAAPGAAAASAPEREGGGGAVTPVSAGLFAVAAITGIGTLGVTATAPQPRSPHLPPSSHPPMWELPHGPGPYSSFTAAAAAGVALEGGFRHSAVARSGGSGAFLNRRTSSGASGSSAELMSVEVERRGRGAGAPGPRSPSVPHWEPEEEEGEDEGGLSRRVIREGAVGAAEGPERWGTHGPPGQGTASFPGEGGPDSAGRYPRGRSAMSSTTAADAASDDELPPYYGGERRQRMSFFAASSPPPGPGHPASASGGIELAFDREAAAAGAVAAPAEPLLPLYPDAATRQQGAPPRPHPFELSSSFAALTVEGSSGSGRGSSTAPQAPPGTGSVGQVPLSSASPASFSPVAPTPPAAAATPAAVPSGAVPSSSSSSSSSSSLTYSASFRRHSRAAQPVRAFPIPGQIGLKGPALFPTTSSGVSASSIAGVLAPAAAPPPPAAAAAGHIAPIAVGPFTSAASASLHQQQHHGAFGGLEMGATGSAAGGSAGESGSPFMPLGPGSSFLPLGSSSGAFGSGGRGQQQLAPPAPALLPLLGLPVGHHHGGHSLPPSPLISPSPGGSSSSSVYGGGPPSGRETPYSHLQGQQQQQAGGNNGRFNAAMVLESGGSGTASGHSSAAGTPRQFDRYPGGGGAYPRVSADSSPRASGSPPPLPGRWGGLSDGVSGHQLSFPGGAGGGVGGVGEGAFLAAPPSAAAAAGGGGLAAGVGYLASAPSSLPPSRRHSTEVQHPTDAPEVRHAFALSQSTLRLTGGGDPTAMGVMGFHGASAGAVGGSPREQQHQFLYQYAPGASGAGTFASGGLGSAGSLGGPLLSPGMGEQDQHPGLPRPAGPVPFGQLRGAGSYPASPATLPEGAPQPGGTIRPPSAYSEGGSGVWGSGGAPVLGADMPPGAGIVMGGSPRLQQQQAGGAAPASGPLPLPLQPIARALSDVMVPGGPTASGAAGPRAGPSGLGAPVPGPPAAPHSPFPAVGFVPGGERESFRAWPIVRSLPHAPSSLPHASASPGSVHAASPTPAAMGAASPPLGQGGPDSLSLGQLQHLREGSSGNKTPASGDPSPRGGLAPGGSPTGPAPLQSAISLWRQQHLRETQQQPQQAAVAPALLAGGRSGAHTPGSPVNLVPHWVSQTATRGAGGWGRPGSVEELEAQNASLSAYALSPGVSASQAAAMQATAAASAAGAGGAAMMSVSGHGSAGPRGSSAAAVALSHAMASNRGAGGYGAAVAAVAVLAPPGGFAASSSSSSSPSHGPTATPHDRSSSLLRRQVAVPGPTSPGNGAEGKARSPQHQHPAPVPPAYAFRAGGSGSGHHHTGGLALAAPRSPTSPPPAPGGGTGNTGGAAAAESSIAAAREGYRRRKTSAASMGPAGEVGPGDLSPSLWSTGVAASGASVTGAMEHRSSGGATAAPSWCAAVAAVAGVPSSPMVRPQGPLPWAHDANTGGGSSVALFPRLSGSSTGSGPEQQLQLQLVPDHGAAQGAAARFTAGGPSAQRDGAADADAEMASPSDPPPPLLHGPPASASSSARVATPATAPAAPCPPAVAGTSSSAFRTQRYPAPRALPM